MRLTTIWTLSAMTLGERLRRTGEWATIKIAARLPKRLAYWSFIHQGVRHIASDEAVPDVRYTDILARLGGGPR